MRSCEMWVKKARLGFSFDGAERFFNRGVGGMRVVTEGIEEKTSSLEKSMLAGGMPL